MKPAGNCSVRSPRRPRTSRAGYGNTEGGLTCGRSWRGAANLNNCFGTLGLFLRCCFSLSSCVNPEICSLNGARTSTRCQQLGGNKVPTRGEAFAPSLSLSKCVTHIMEPFLLPSHARISNMMTCGISLINFSYLTAAMNILKAGIFTASA